MDRSEDKEECLVAAGCKKHDHLGLMVANEVSAKEPPDHPTAGIGDGEPTRAL
jgi:hypothetical protein